MYKNVLTIIADYIEPYSNYKVGLISMKTFILNADKEDLISLYNNAELFDLFKNTVSELKGCSIVKFRDHLMSKYAKDGEEVDIVVVPYIAIIDDDLLHNPREHYYRHGLLWRLLSERIIYTSYTKKKIMLYLTYSKILIECYNVTINIKEKADDEDVDFICFMSKFDPNPIVYMNYLCYEANKRNNKTLYNKLRLRLT